MFYIGSIGPTPLQHISPPTVIENVVQLQGGGIRVSLSHPPKLSK